MQVAARCITGDHPPASAGDKVATGNMVLTGAQRYRPARVIAIAQIAAEQHNATGCGIGVPRRIIGLVWQRFAVHIGHLQ